MHDKAHLGNRYVCFQCGTRFYDLNRPEPLCPECSADQRTAPVRDIKALLAGKKGRSDEIDDADDADALDDDMALDDEDEDEDEEEEQGEFGEDE